MSHLLVGTENPASLVVGRHNAELRSPSFGRRLTAQDLLTRSWKMAHRGGSAWRPEMTRKAYLDSAIVGCDVLEFSVGRTSDGVYFGLHDESIDRTTAGTGNASALTWAQVNSYTVDVPRWPGVDPQPHYRLEDFIADFADTHVLMLDPKHIWADGFVQEFFDFVLARTDNTRVVMKFSFPGPGFPDAAAARGFLTWGYAYDSNNPADAQHWDLVGLDIRATAQTWANFKAQGKPLTAHIINSQTEANLGAQRGATSFQCARPDAIHLRDTVVYVEPLTFVEFVASETSREHPSDASSSPEQPFTVLPELVAGDFGIVQITTDGSGNNYTNADWTDVFGEFVATNLAVRIHTKTLEATDTDWDFTGTTASGRGLSVWFRNVTDVEWGTIARRTDGWKTVQVPGITAQAGDVVLLVCGDRTVGDVDADSVPTPNDIPSAPGFEYLAHCQGIQTNGVYSGISSPAVLIRYVAEDETIPETDVLWPDNSANAYGVMVRLRA